MFYCLPEYGKAIEYYDKALAIYKEIVNRGGEVANYLDLGTAFRSLGKYDQAKEYLEKALAMTKELGERAGEGACYGLLGNLQHAL